MKPAICVAAWCLALSLGACGPSPQPPAEVVLTVHAGADQNPDASGHAAPVAVRVFQLTSTGKFERADVFALIDRERQTLGTDDAGSQEVVLAPSEVRTLTIKTKPDVTAIGVIALFRNIDHAQWRVDAPVAASGQTKMAADIGKLSITLKQAQ